MSIRSNSFNFDNIISGDNGKATFFAYSQVMSNSLIVGKSANIGTPTTELEIQEGRSLPGIEPMRGHSIYDGPCGIVNVHFAGFNGRHIAIQTTGAAQKSTVHFTRGITFAADIPERNKVDFSQAPFMGYMWSSGLIDEDGSITRKPGSTLMSIIQPDNRMAHASFDKEFNAALVSTEKPEWSARINEGNPVGLLRVDPGWAQGSAEIIQVTRCGGGVGCHTVTDVGTYNWYYQNPVFVNHNFTYYFTFPKLPAFTYIHLQFIKPGDKVRVVVLNVPSTSELSGSRKVNTIQELEGAKETSHVICGSTLHMLLVGGPAYPQRQPFGPRFSSTTLVGVRFYPAIPLDARVNILSDFNAGVDSRISLHSLNADFRGPFTGWDNTINWWDVISRGNGQDGMVDMYLKPEQPQDWRFAQALKVKTVLAGEYNNQSYKYQVFIHDVDQGFTHLGNFENGEVSTALSTVPIANRDQVDSVMIRVLISQFADLKQAGSFQRVHLDYLQLV